MNITKQQSLDVIYESLDGLNEQLPDDKQMAKSPDTILLGDNGGLDSLGFVNFIGVLEEGLESRLKCSPGLSGPNDSFETVQNLVDLIFSKVSK